MIEVEEMIEIKILREQGLGIRRIARETGLSKNTVKKYLNKIGDNFCYQKRPFVKSKLSDYKNYLMERQKYAYPERIPGTVLYREILAKGYQGKLSILREFLHKIRFEEKEEIVRYETPPGKQMQVDWAEFQGGKNRLSAFIATLGCSRMSYVEFVDNERIETLLACLVNAFNFFGGVTIEILFDNMKTVVTQRNAYAEGHHRFNIKLWEFAKDYGFIPKLCKPYRAQTKGKVERFIGYLRKSFYIPFRSSLKQANLEVTANAANIAIMPWLNDVANVRIHADLKQKPIVLFEEEKKHLQFIPVIKHITSRTADKEMTNTTKLYSFSEKERVLNVYQHDLSIYEQIINMQGETNEFTA